MSYEWVDDKKQTVIVALDTMFSRMSLLSDGKYVVGSEQTINHAPKANPPDQGWQERYGRCEQPQTVRCNCMHSSSSSPTNLGEMLVLPGFVLALLFVLPRVFVIVILLHTTICERADQTNGYETHPVIEERCRTETNRRGLSSHHHRIGEGFLCR